MNHHLQIHKLARGRGKDLSQLSKAEYIQLALEVRSFREIRTDAVEAAKSAVKVRAGIRVVPLVVLDERKATCRSNRCGSYGTVGKQGYEACHRCNCVGKMLEIKWQDPNQECPAKPPLWLRYVGECKAVT